MLPRYAITLISAAAILAGVSVAAASSDAPIGAKVFVDRGSPPTFHVQRVEIVE